MDLLSKKKSSYLSKVVILIACGLFIIYFFIPSNEILFSAEENNGSIGKSITEFAPGQNIYYTSPLD